MSSFRKIKAGLVNHPIENFIGEKGNIFFNVDTGELRLSDGVTPGGIPIMMGGGGGYVLLPATETTLGGIKVGNNLTILPDGTLSAVGSASIDYGNFSVPNDARTNVYVMRNTTVGTANTELFLDGSSQRLIVSPNSVWTYVITVAAKRIDTNTDAAAFKIVGAVARNTPASSIFMVGNNVSNTVIGRTDETWDTWTDVNVSYGALTVNVKGSLGKTIRWVARVETTEVNFAV